MELRYENKYQENSPPIPAQSMFDGQVKDEQDQKVRLEMAIEWAHLGGD